MAEYIERKALIEALKRECPNLYYASEHELIRTFPAVDVKPVVHAEWSIVYVDRGHIDMEKMYKCSACGGRKYNDYLYCPECGARMDGGNE